MYFSEITASYCRIQTENRGQLLIKIADNIIKRDIDP
jgi:hypothetical protein